MARTRSHARSIVARTVTLSSVARTVVEAVAVHASPGTHACWGSVVRRVVRASNVDQMVAEAPVGIVESARPVWMACAVVQTVPEQYADRTGVEENAGYAPPAPALAGCVWKGAPEFQLWDAATLTRSTSATATNFCP